MGKSPAMLAACLGLLGAAPARAADTESYEVTLHTAPGCPTADELHADVAAHVSDAPRAAGTRVDLRVEPTGAGFFGELVSTDPTGHQGYRRIEGRTCSEVAHALAFLAGLAIDVAGRAGPGLAASSAAANRDSVVPEPTTLATPTAQHAQPLSLSAIALTEMRGGLGPQAGVAAALGVEVVRPMGRGFAPSVFLALDAGTSHLRFPQGSADLSLGSARLLLCPLRLSMDVLSFHPCAGAEVGAVYAVGSPPVQPRSALEPWVSLEGALRVQWLVTTRFFLEAEAAATLPLFRARYFFEPDLTVYAVPLVTGRGALGIGLRL